MPERQSVAVKAGKLSTKLCTAFGDKLKTFFTCQSQAINRYLFLYQCLTSVTNIEGLWACGVGFKDCLKNRQSNNGVENTPPELVKIQAIHKVIHRFCG